MLRRVFEVPTAPSSATLFATALGLYEFELNGTRVGDTELTPGSSNYAETLYAQAFDVLAHLTPGRNVLEFTLTDGWYRGRNGGRQRQNAWGEKTALLAQLELEDRSGRTIIATGADWDAATSEIVRADLMHGQSTDFRLGRVSIAKALVNSVSAPLPAWSPAPPVRRIEEREPFSVREIRPGVSIVDAGQNLAGWIRLTDLGPVGSETVLEFAEYLAPDGDITTTHLDMLTPSGERMPGGQRDTAIAGADAGTFEPRHTVHGFRYARISHPGRRLDPNALAVIVVHSDLRRTGHFESDDDDLNQLYSAAVWSFRSNAVDVPTDCPTRERSGWTGDFQVFAPTAAQIFDIDGFASKWLRSVQDDQLESGVPAAFSPDSERSKLHPELPTATMGGSAGWGDAIIEVPWTLYHDYGDVETLAATWDSMIKFVEYALFCAKDMRHPSREAARPTAAAHEQFIWDAPFHFGEWLEPKRRRSDGTLVDPMADDVFAYMSADRGEVGTAYLFRMLRRMSSIAALLGRQDDAWRFTELATNVRDAWQLEFLTPDGRITTDSQAAYVRALAFDLLPVATRGASARRLVELIDDSGGHLGTGFLSTGMLLSVLADSGFQDVAWRVLKQRSSPSWLYMIDQGATTVWEDWDGVTPDGEAHESLNHYSKGAVVRYLNETIGGVRQAPDSVAWERFDVSPLPRGYVNRAGFSYVTPRGPLSARWSYDDETLKVDVVVPSRSRAVVKLPSGKYLGLGSGRHQLTFEE